MKKIIACLIACLIAVSVTGCAVKVKYTVTATDGTITEALYERPVFVDQQLEGLSIDKKLDGSLKVKLDGQRSQAAQIADMLGQFNNLLKTVATAGATGAVK